MCYSIDPVPLTLPAALTATAESRRAQRSDRGVVAGSSAVWTAFFGFDDLQACDVADAHNVSFT